jgi:ribosomal protein S6--L-glutamate ligase/gamma-F420-2:alpha-L-glutamate ligase
LKGILVFNRYYSDDGQAYVRARLAERLKARGAVLESPALYGGIAAGLAVPKADFAVFWDKDVALAQFLERQGIRVYNRSGALEVCDDKRKTYEALTGSSLTLIPTLFAPLAYRKTADGDDDLITAVEHALGYPAVVKENVGSLGQAVYLAKNRAELTALHRRLQTVPHQYQKFIGTPGRDLRIYTVGGKAVAAVRRENKKSFISNAAKGGTTEAITPDKTLTDLAETAAKALGLDYGAVDFLQGSDGQYYFLEANSNAYFKAAEAAGADIADRIAEHICKTYSVKI